MKRLIEIHLYLLEKGGEGGKENKKCVFDISEKT